MVVHPGDAARVVAGLCGGVVGVGGGQCAVGAATQQEVFDFGADPRFEARVGCLGDHRLENDARREGPRFAVDMWVAVHDRQSLLEERDRGERVWIWNGHQVRVFGLLADGADGISGESDTLGGEQVDGLDRHQLGARLAAQVDEQGENEFRPGCLGEDARSLDIVRKPCLL